MPWGVVVSHPSRVRPPPPPPPPLSSAFFPIPLISLFCAESAGRTGHYLHIFLLISRSVHPPAEPHTHVSSHIFPFLYHAPVPLLPQALAMDADDFEDAFRFEKPDPSKDRLVFFCRSGVRSANACAIAQELGYKKYVWLGSSFTLACMICLSPLHLVAWRLPDCFAARACAQPTRAPSHRSSDTKSGWHYFLSVSRVLMICLSSLSCEEEVTWCSFAARACLCHRTGARIQNVRGAALLFVVICLFVLSISRHVYMFHIPISRLHASGVSRPSPRVIFVSDAPANSTRPFAFSSVANYQGSYLDWAERNGLTLY